LFFFFKLQLFRNFYASSFSRSDNNNGKNNGPLGIFTQIEIRVTCWADVFTNHSSISDVKRSVRQSDTGETIENLQSTIHFIQSHLVFRCFFFERESGYRAPGKSTPLSSPLSYLSLPAWIMRLSDITAGVRAVATAHC